jgi:hypothetical protein
MKKNLRVLLLMFLGLFLYISFPKETHAFVDIKLTEEKENILGIEVDSHGSSIEGLVMEIFHPAELYIDENNIVKNDEYCTISNNIILGGDSFTIECFNDQETTLDGKIMEIPFATDLEDYFFYVNQDNLDIGVLNLGTVEDINRPENITFEEVDEDLVEEDVDTENFSPQNLIPFLSDNSIYVLVAGLALFTIAIIFMLKTLKRN